MSTTQVYNRKALAVLLSAIIIMSSALVFTFTTQTGTAYGSYYNLGVQLTPEGSVKLGVGEPKTFTASVAGGMYPYTFTWSSQVHYADNTTGSVVEFKQETFTQDWTERYFDNKKPISSWTFDGFPYASEDYFIVMVDVQDATGAKQGEMVYVFDPYTSPDQTLNGANAADWSYKIEADGLGWYRAVDGEDMAIAWSSPDASYTIQSCVDNLVKGRICLNTGTYYAQNINVTSFIEIHGAGVEKTTITRTQDYPIFNFKQYAGTSNVQDGNVLADLTLESGYNNTFLSNVVEMDQIKNSKFMRLYFSNPKGNCFYITGGDDVTVRSFWNNFEDIRAGTIQNHSTGAVFVITKNSIDSYVNKVTTSNMKYVVYSTGTRGAWEFHNLWGVLCTNTIYLNATDYTIANMVFYNTKVDTQKEHGIYMHSSIYDISLIQFYGIEGIAEPGSYDLIYAASFSPRVLSDIVFDSISGYGNSLRYIINLNCDTQNGISVIRRVYINNNFHADAATARYNFQIPINYLKVGFDPRYVTSNIAVFSNIVNGTAIATGITAGSPTYNSISSASGLYTVWLGAINATHAIIYGSNTTISGTANFNYFATP